jgi:hypothetical protein
MLDADELEDPEVLLGLRLPSLDRVHDEEAGIDGADAGEHVLEEPDVTGDVDEPELSPAGERRPCEPQVDRQPARLLLGQAVRVDARQCPDERRLAVIDVAGGGDDVHAATD